MKKILLYIFAFIFSVLHSVAQSTQENIIYVVDSIPVIEDQEDGNEIQNEDIADITVIKNKDTLRILGYEKYDGIIYVFTKEYRKRPEELKKIPSSKQMERENGIWHFHGQPYSGKFIDYFYNGKKQGEGIFKKGKVDGSRIMFHQNGQIALERYYTNGIENGLEKEYYEDGSLKQKGEFVNGIEEGIWEMYFPNGQTKQRSFFKNGKMEGETTVYYSTGKILAVEITKNGITTPDKRLEKLNQVINKGHVSSKEGDYKTAIKYYSKVLELDTANAEAYFSRGTAKLNNFKFDEAISDFNKALLFEPFFKNALSNRAFARIRKHQFGSGRKLSEKNGVTVMASKDNPGIPEWELTIICNDLKQAIFLGDRGKMIVEAFQEFCGSKNSR